jgi:hypothetical protein
MISAKLSSCIQVTSQLEEALGLSLQRAGTPPQGSMVERFPREASGNKKAS